LARPFRNTIIIGLVSLGTALSAVGGWRYARASAPVSGPIILVSVDALRADRLPAYGYTKLRTPAIEALAADGVVFERAYSHVPQTLPAHASLLSGRLPFETGVRDNAGFAVKREERLLAEMLADRGYATAGVVSSYVLRSSTGIAQGFSFFDGDMPEGSAADPRAGLVRDGADSVAIAENWLEEAGTERAFLFLHLYEPHSPYAPPSRFAAHEPYDGEIAYVDELVGRFVKFLKAHQLYDQSTIILLSDHGEGLGDHGEMEHGLLAHEESLRIPLIVKPAAGQGAGRRVADVVQHIDIVPTILDLAKAPIPDNLNGRSLTGLIEGDGSHFERIVYSESLLAAYRFGWSDVRSVSDGRHRLIRAAGEETYVAVDDPASAVKVTDEETPKLAGLRAALDRLVAGAPVHLPSPVGPETRTRLAALGYGGALRPMTPVDRAHLIDPHDRVDIAETYRAAFGHAVDREWRQALQLLDAILRQHPEMPDVWHQLGEFAVGAGRLERAVEAHRREAALRPDDPSGHLGAAAALLRLLRFEDARQQAELAADVASATDRGSRASAHELLARIAVARRDAVTAREQAELARRADPTMPMPAYIDGRLLHVAGRYDEALPLFETAIADLTRSNGPPILELHFYAADALIQLERLSEAEYHLLEELRRFPQNVRARGALATVYHQTGRSDEAGQELTDLVRISPTQEGYAAAARLWTAFGNRRQAAAVRAEAAAVLSRRGPTPATQ
jgi:arylsulfatase A-like enzyme/tetratricopeptide (TPR) repeat protein